MKAQGVLILGLGLFLTRMLSCGIATLGEIGKALTAKFRERTAAMRQLRPAPSFGALRTR